MSTEAVSEKRFQAVCKMNTRAANRRAISSFPWEGRVKMGGGAGYVNSKGALSRARTAAAAIHVPVNLR